MHASRLLRLAPVIIAPLLTGAATPPPERVFDVPSSFTVIIQGRTVTFRPDPGAAGLPLLRPALARDMGLTGKGLMSFAVAHQIGHERVFGRTQKVDVTWPGMARQKRRVGWMSRDYDASYDGTIGPMGVDEPVVRFRLRPARPDEIDTVFPMVMPKGLTAMFAGTWAISYGAVDIAGTPTRIQFDPYHAHSLATAHAAVPIASAHGGQMSRETGRQEIAFGVDRPYRVMTLTTPLAIGGITLSRIGVRVSDDDIAGRISEADAPPPTDADPDEIVITAKEHPARSGLLILGADALANCSTITFDKKARQIHLSCARA